MPKTLTDNEWAAQVMGWIYNKSWDTDGFDFEDWRDSDGVLKRFVSRWNPDTDANDFRELLNSKAVQEWRVRNKLFSLDEWWCKARHDQPAALCQLREAMDG